MNIPQHLRTPTLTLALWLGIIHCAAPLHAAERDPAQLTLMTFNILRPDWAQPNMPAWSDRLPLIQETIRSHQAVVVGLQEETEEMRQEVLAGLPGWEAIGEVPPKGATIIYQTEHISVLSHGSSPSPGERTIQWAQLRTRDGAKLWLFNAHFSPFEEKTREQTADVLQALIREKLAENSLPVVVCGDLNTGPGAPSYQDLVASPELPLRSAYQAAQGRIDPAAIAHLYQVQRDALFERYQQVRAGEAVPAADEHYLSLRSASTIHGFARHGINVIDHILVSPDIEVVSAQVLQEPIDGQYPSDHYPVISTLSLPE